MDSNVPPHRAFPLEAIVLFPLLGPPALALLGATLYAAMLMIFLLSPGAILALPVYFFFWASMAYAALWPAAAAAGVLYALAVRFFAPPVVVTAMIAGAIGAVGYGIALILLGLAPFGNLPDGSGISLGKGHSQTSCSGRLSAWLKWCRAGGPQGRCALGSQPDRGPVRRMNDLVASPMPNPMSP